jgi:hypothetical protein
MVAGKLLTLAMMMSLVAPISAAIMQQYPFIRGLQVSYVGFQNGNIVVYGTMRVYFTPLAWTEFGYKAGNFYWFNLWWQTKALGMPVGCFKLVSMKWTLVEHTENYDVLNFVMVLTW